MAQTEVDRLLATGYRERLDVCAFVSELEPVISRLATARGVTLDVDLPADAVLIDADRVILRQALLMAVSLMLDLSAVPLVSLRAVGDERVTGIALRADTAADEVTLAGVDERLKQCQKLMSALDGRLHLTPSSTRGLELQLLWRLTAPDVVLVIDDNQGIAELFRRYLMAHDWQVRGASGAAEARHALAEIRPSLIILDVMMPQEDGWELLMSLKQDDRTRLIPTVICSVLQDPQLALTLGADAYLSKPVSQQALLDLLETTGLTTGR